MRFRIHFTLKDGSDDSVDLTGETIEEIQEMALAETSKRGAAYAWSEEVK